MNKSESSKLKVTPMEEKGHFVRDGDTEHESKRLRTNGGQARESMASCYSQPDSQSFHDVTISNTQASMDITDGNTQG